MRNYSIKRMDTDATGVVYIQIRMETLDLHTETASHITHRELVVV